jgi:hypothetical protein
MGNKRRILLAAIVVVAMGVLTWFLIRPREPVYDGKPLSVWLQRYGDLNYDTVSEQLWHREADEAVRKIGTNALPLLLELLEAKDSKFKLKMKEIAGKQSIVKFHFTTAETRQRMALEAFRVLGPAAKPAIPELAEILVREPTMAAPALSAIGPESIGTLTNALASTNGEIRIAVVIVLEQYADKVYQAPEGKLSPEDLLRFRADATRIVPALERCTNDPDGNTREQALETLTYFKEAASKASVK